jgi:hypothetical protein
MDPLFQFLNLYAVDRTPWTGDQPVERPLPTHRTTQTQNKPTQTSTPRVGFEPTLRVFERAKIVHDFDHASSVIVVNLPAIIPELSVLSRVFLRVAMRCDGQSTSPKVLY